MKEELIELARKLRFESQFLYNTSYKYSNKEELRYYFWLCELQKWLREVHKLYINIRFIGYHKDNHDAYRGLVLDKKALTLIDLMSDIKEDYYIFRSYEDCLEKGLYEALKLINNESKTS